MTTIQKTAMNCQVVGKSVVKKTINRAALPTVSGLALLAGSSMNGNNKPDNAGPHDPGSSVDDSAWEQIKYAGKLVKEAGEEIGKGAKELGETILDFLDDIF